MNWINNYTPNKNPYGSYNPQLSNDNYLNELRGTGQNNNVKRFSQNPQNYTGGPYMWKQGGASGYRGYSGNANPFGRDLGYINDYQGIGGYNKGLERQPYYNDPFNPFDDDYRGGLGWNLRRRR